MRFSIDTEARQFVIEENGETRPLHHVVLHSPSGMNFSFGGSGPADLALSILADFFGENPSEDALYYGQAHCIQLHQQFKWCHTIGQHHYQRTCIGWGIGIYQW